MIFINTERHYFKLSFYLLFLLISIFSISASKSHDCISFVQAKKIIAGFPDKPITKKPLEVRQGKGKGNVEYWVAQIRPGAVLYEMEGVSEEVAREALRLASAKLPVRITFAAREVM